MATVVTRASKGSALTWTEGDANITNLNNDKIEAVVEDTTPQLGGNLDVNGHNIIATGSGNINIFPDTGYVNLGAVKMAANLDLDGNGIVSASGPISITAPEDLDVNISTSGLGGIAIQGIYYPNNDGTNGQVLTTNGSGNLSFTTLTAGIGNVVEDTTPQLGGNLDVNGQSIVSASNGNIAITPNGTGSIVLDGQNWPQADGTANYVLKTNGSGQLSWTNTVDGTNKFGYLNLPAVGTKTSSYTLATSDVGKYVQVGSGGSITIPNSTFAEGDAIVIVNNHTAGITITCSITDAYIAGTDTDKASVTLATRGIATIVFVSATRCIISGNVS